tara:strand:- start:23 stop:424 length:402 start_codon:yes stop_codon:yes gene_type:complete
MTKYTVHFPLETDGTNVFRATESLNGTVLFNIKNALLACPGERPMEPTFGFCLKKFLFENPTQSMFEEMHSGIIQSLKTWLPYLSVSNVNISYDENSPHLLSIIINYHIPNQLPSSQITFTLNTTLQEVSTSF